jgi:hypothetical protein
MCSFLGKALVFWLVMQGITLIPRLSSAATSETLEFGLWGAPESADINNELFRVYQTGIGGVKKIFVMHDFNSLTYQLNTYFNDAETVAGIRFFTTFSYDGSSVGKVWEEAEPRGVGGRGSMYYRDQIVNELNHTSTGNPSCSEGLEPVCAYTITWNSTKGTPEINVASEGFSGTLFKNLAEEGFNRHRVISDTIYRLQSHFGVEKNVAGSLVGGDQAGAVNTNYSRSKRFHSLLRAVSEMVKMYNANRGSNDALTNIGDPGKDFVISIPGVWNTVSNAAVQNNVKAAVDGSSIAANLLPEANVISMYSHLYMRYYDKKPPWLRLDRQVSGANQALSKAGIKIEMTPQAHIQDWYEAILQRMPQDKYHCDAENCFEAMTPSQKVRAMMAPDAHFTINQFYYALATGTSDMVLYIPTSKTMTSLDRYKAMDVIPKGSKQFWYIDPVGDQYSHRERKLGLISLMWEAQNLKNVPKFIFDSRQYSNPDEFWTDPPIRFVNAADQTDYRSVRLKKVVTDANTPDHLSSGAMSFVSEGRIISDPDGDFLNRGFVPGMKILISGSSFNDGMRTIAADGVTPTIITVIEPLADEEAGGSDRLQLLPTFHDVITVFRWDQSDPFRKTYIYTEPSVSRRAVPLEQVIDIGNSDFDPDSRYDAIYQWSPTGLHPISRTAKEPGGIPLFRNSSIRVSEHRPVILICKLKDGAIPGTPYDDGTVWDLESLYHPFGEPDFEKGWKKSMIDWLGTTSGIGTLRHVLASGDGWVEPPTGFGLDGENGDSDTLYYYRNSALQDDKDNCPDLASADSEEAAEAVRFIHWQRRLNWVTRSPTMTAYVPPNFVWSAENVAEDNGCSGASRAQESFTNLFRPNGTTHQRWNYFFRFNSTVIPPATYERSAPSMYPWLDPYNEWLKCE